MSTYYNPSQEPNSPIWDIPCVNDQTQFEDFAQALQEKFAPKFNVNDIEEGVLSITLDGSVDSDTMTFWEVDAVISLEGVNDLQLEIHVDGMPLTNVSIKANNFLNETSVEGMINMFKSFDMLYKTMR